MNGMRRKDENRATSNGIASRIDTGCIITAVDHDAENVVAGYEALSAPSAGTDAQ